MHADHLKTVSEQIRREIQGEWEEKEHRLTAEKAQAESRLKELEEICATRLKDAAYYEGIFELKEKEIKEARRKYVEIKELFDDESSKNETLSAEVAKAKKSIDKANDELSRSSKKAGALQEEKAKL
jgi:chromosome segregation ATPase